MATTSGSSADYWRNYFATAKSDIWDIIDQAIMVAASDCPREFRLRRDQIAERLFSCKMTRCSGCDCVELAVPGDDDENGDFKNSKDDKRDTNMNQVSNLSFGEVEALTDEIEEEGLIFEEVLRIKEILDNSKDETDSVLFESLRKLQLMAVTVHTLKATEIGKSVVRLRKHGSREIRQLSRTLVEFWKDMVDEWVSGTAAITTGAEGTPDSVNPSVLDDEEGLPFPPLEDGLFFMTQPASMELSGFFDGMDDDGNPHGYGDNSQNRRNGRKPTAAANRDITKLKHNKPHNVELERIQQVRQPEVVVKPKAKPNKPLNKVSVQKKPLTTQQDNDQKLKNSDEMKLAGAVRKLQERYQQVEKAKRQRTIQVMDLQDLPKPKQQAAFGQRNLQMKPGFHNRNGTTATRR